MQPLDMDALLPLTCTRSGSCCHGHRIATTAWEIALLARGLGLSQRQVRDGYTQEGGTFLRLEAAREGSGAGTCILYHPERGCIAHASRPLACRVYPLARRRHQEATFYTFATPDNPCLTRCPTVKDLPFHRLGDWLASQQVGPGQAAHDAYGNLVWGMIITAARIAAASGMPLAPIAQEGTRRASLGGEARVSCLPSVWFDLLTIPALDVALDDGAGFVAAHALRLQEAIASNYALPPALEEVALMVVTLALHLAPCVGIDAMTAVAAFAAEAQERKQAMAPPASR